MSEPYVATFRVTIMEDTEVGVNLVFEALRDEMMLTLDEQEGDSVVITQIIPFTLQHIKTPQEICDVLRRDRNILIATKIKELWDIARSIDQTIHILETGSDQLIDYNYTQFLELAESIFKGEAITV